MRGMLFWLLWLVIGVVVGRTFTVSHDEFVLDGRPFQILCSSFHYFRCPPPLWPDRLARLKAMGVNAVEAYVPWNFHESAPGSFSWSGNRNVSAFLALCQSMDLLVLLRPGPYICAEWEFGGFPFWILNIEGLQLRTFEPKYLAAVERFWKELFNQVRPYLIENGGPIVMAQMENEFGSWGDTATNPLDRKYIEYLVQLTRSELSRSLVLYTTDPIDHMAKGTLQGDAVISMPDFGPGVNASAAWAAQRLLNAPGKSPRLCSEYYVGWISHWGQAVANTSSTLVASWLDALLSDGASVSLYMGFGGTNYAFWNGANTNPELLPQIQSYDYDAPVSENGAHGYGALGRDKFEAVRAVLSKYHASSLPPEPPFVPIAVPGQVEAASGASVFDVLDQLPAHGMTHDPVNMEQFNQSFGYILYRRTGALPAGTISVPQLNDRLIVFADEKPVATRYHGDSHSVDIPAVIRSLDFLVENVGRVNFGRASMSVNQTKGLNGTIRHSVAGNVNSFASFTLDFEKQLNVSSHSACARLPCVHEALVTLQSDAADVFVSTDGWGKGILLVNGVNIGRFLSVKPQRTLWVSRVFLRAGTNRFTWLETDILQPNPSISFTKAAIFQK